MTDTPCNPSTPWRTRVVIAAVVMAALLFATPLLPAWHAEREMLSGHGFRWVCGMGGQMSPVTPPPVSVPAVTPVPAK